jgi:hypothetical protein
LKNDLKEMVPEHLVMLAKVCQGMMNVLNARLLVLLGLLMSCGMFAWAMYQPDNTRTVVACAFAVLVYWPLGRLEAIRQRKVQEAE